MTDTQKIHGLDCILLVDDDEITNLIHRRIIEKSGLEVAVKVVQDAQSALDYLIDINDPDYIKPGIIFLDINMPGMSGWEFLEKYNQLPEHCKVRAVIVMLTTSVDPDDIRRAETTRGVHSYLNKTLTAEKLDGVINAHFNSSNGV